MTVHFEYPVVYFVGDDYGDSYVVWKHARARLLNLTDNLFEFLITAEENSFHVLCGTCKKGVFLCLPSRNAGCILFSLEDISQNITDIQADFGRVSFEDATVVAYAFKELNPFA